MDTTSPTIRGGPTAVRLLLLICLVTTLLVPASSAEAVPGEILQRGSDIAGEPYRTTRNGNTVARINFSNLNECPPGVTSCWLEVRWSWRRSTSLSWSTSNWLRVPVGQDFHTYCANGRHRYSVESRVAWNSSATRTVDVSGQSEVQLSASGSWVNRVIAKALYVRGYGGLSLSSSVSSSTGTSGSSSHATLGSTGGGYIETSC